MSLIEVHSQPFYNPTVHQLIYVMEDVPIYRRLGLDLSMHKDNPLRRRFPMDILRVEFNISETLEKRLEDYLYKAGNFGLDLNINRHIDHPAVYELDFSIVDRPLIEKIGRMTSVLSITDNVLISVCTASMGKN